jgi:hypothetical protein
MRNTIEPSVPGRNVYIQAYADIRFLDGMTIHLLLAVLAAFCKLHDVAM